MNKRLVMVPFSRLDAEEPAEKFSSATFASLYGHLTLTHSREVGLLRQPPGASANPNEAAIVARARELRATNVLLGQPTGDGNARALTVRLIDVADGSVKWTESYPLANAEPSEVADKIADKVIEEFLRREGRGPPKP